MKKLGIVGGIGPESTIDYYRMLVSTYRARVGDGHYPCVIVNSIDLQRLVDWFNAGDLASVADHLVEAVDVLARAGANIGLLAANTPHLVFDDLSRRSAIPLISIVEAACAAARAGGLGRLALLGTRFTMQGRFYHDVFERAGIALVVPDAADQAWVHARYMDELVNGVVLDETRDGLLAIVDRLRDREGIDGVLLAGTELSLVIRQESHAGVTFLDTARIHVQRAVEAIAAPPS